MDKYVNSWPAFIDMDFCKSYIAMSKHELNANFEKYTVVKI